MRSGLDGAPAPATSGCRRSARPAADPSRRGRGLASIESRSRWPPFSRSTSAGRRSGGSSVALALVGVAEVLRRLDELAVDVGPLDSYSRCATRVLGGVPGVRRERRPAAHAGEVPVLGVGELHHLVARPSTARARPGGRTSTRWPRRDWLLEVTVSMRAAARQPDELLAACGDEVRERPEEIIGRSASYVFSVESSENAVIWIFGVGHGMPFGSPSSYGYSQPHRQPWSRRRSPRRARPSHRRAPGRRPRGRPARR
jgi:hypothetical protein